MTNRQSDPEGTRAYYENVASARWIALAGICIGCFLAALSLMAVNVAIPMIANDLAATSLHMSLLPTTFVAANAITILPIGRLSDSWGRKKVFIGGLSCLLISSFMAALSPTIEILLFCRALQGVSTSMIFACAMGIIATIFNNPKKRGVSLGITASSVYLGVTCGPLLGGWVTENFGWRWVLAFPVPLLALTVVLLLARLKGDWHSNQAKNVDWIGSIVFGVCIILMLAGLAVAPSDYAIVLVSASIVTGWLFFWYQKQIEHPLIRLAFFVENRVFTRSILSAMMMYAALNPSLFILNLYLQYIQGLSPSRAGLYLTLQAVFVALIAPLSGRFSALFRTRTLGTLGCLCSALGYMILMWLDKESSLSLVVTSLVVIGLGFGIFSTPNNSSAMGSITHSDSLGMASALLGLSRTIGTMIGTAVVVLLMVLFMKGQPIEPSNYSQLLSMVHYTMTLSLLFTLLGVYSASRNLSKPDQGLPR